MNETSKENPLTLNDLVDYNQKALLPVLDKRSNRIESDLKEVKGDVKSLKSEVGELKIDVGGLKLDVQELKEGQERIEKNHARFRDDVFTSLDQILKHIEILRSEKSVYDYKAVSRKRLDQIIVDSLKNNRLLTDGQLNEIYGLEMI